jgi:hypothetical protein
MPSGKCTRPKKRVNARTKNMLLLTKLTLKIYSKETNRRSCTSISSPFDTKNGYFIYVYSKPLTPLSNLVKFLRSQYIRKVVEKNIIKKWIYLNPSVKKEEK